MEVLRDDGHLLTDPEGLFDATEAQKVSEHASAKEHPPLSLYPFGFSASSLVDAIEAEAVWTSV